MQSGSVIVEGPFIDGGIALPRGQRLGRLSAAKSSSVEDIKPDVQLGARPPRRCRRRPREEPAARRRTVDAESPRRARLGQERRVRASSRSCSNEAEKRGVDHTIATAFAR